MRNPVHRRSRLKGSFETGFYPNYQRGFASKVLEAAEVFDRRKKKAHEKSGPLGLSAIVVLRELTRFINYASGQVDPELKTLARRCKMSKQTVVSALKRLAKAGFVKWVRRIVYVGMRSLFGQVVAQTSNAYAMALPAEAAELVKNRPAPLPTPDDHEARRTAKAVELREMEMQERDDALKKAGLIRRT